MLVLVVLISVPMAWIANERQRNSKLEATIKSLAHELRTSYSYTPNTIDFEYEEPETQFESLLDRMIGRRFNSVSIDKKFWTFGENRRELVKQFYGIKVLRYANFEPSTNDVIGSLPDLEVLIIPNGMKPAELVNLHSLPPIPRVKLTVAYSPHESEEVKPAIAKLKTAVPECDFQISLRLNKWPWE